MARVTVQVDDAGVGDLLFGAIIGAHRKETGEFHYDIIPVNYFQMPDFRKKLYLKKATEVTLRLLEEMKLGPEEEVEICRSFVFDETREELFRKFGRRLQLSLGMLSTMWRRPILTRSEIWATNLYPTETIRGLEVSSTCSDGSRTTGRG